MLYAYILEEKIGVHGHSVTCCLWKVIGGNKCGVFCALAFTPRQVWWFCQAVLCQGLAVKRAKIYLSINACNMYFCKNMYKRIFYINNKI